MSNYGRNFEFRIPPKGSERYGRVKVPSTGTALPIGAPASINSAVATDARGLATLSLVTTATNPLAGRHGIVVFEYKNDEAFAGHDVNLTQYSDLNTVPLGASVQLVSGRNVKVLFRNSVAETFLETTAYGAFTIVAGIGIATPTLAVGDYLTPGTGDSTSGYWAEGTSTNGWFYITSVDNNRGEVEARMTF